MWLWLLDPLGAHAIHPFGPAALLAVTLTMATSDRWTWQKVQSAMRQVPAFLATLVAFTAVLLLGPQWGIALGLASFAVGDTLLLRRELRALRRQIDQMQTELPLQVHEQISQRIQALEQALSTREQSDAVSVATTNSESAPASEPPDDSVGRQPQVSGREQGTPPLSDDEVCQLLDSIYQMVAKLSASQQVSPSSASAKQTTPDANPDSASKPNRPRRNSREVDQRHETHERTEDAVPPVGSHAAEAVTDRGAADPEIPEVVEKLIHRVAVVLAENIRVSTTVSGQPDTQSRSRAKSAPVDVQAVALPPKSVDLVQQQWQAGVQAKPRKTKSAARKSKPAT
jgi:hypothetical protein